MLSADGVISKKRKVCTLTARIVPGTIARHPRAIDRSRVEAWSRVARGRGSRPDAVTVDAAFVRVLRARASEPSPSSSVVSPGRVR